MYTSDERSRMADSITVTGSIVNLILVVLKILAGIFGRSSALIADAIHSLSDFATDIVVIFSMRMTRKPRDTTHRYGHGKFETLAAMIIGMSLFGVGAGIAWSSFKTASGYLRGTGELSMPGFIASAAAFLSIVAKEILYRLTVRTALKIKSPALKANAWHHRSDAFSSVATFAGTLAARLLGDAWIILDPLAAFTVSVLILKTAYDITMDSIRELLESSLPENEEEAILSVITDTKGVIDPHNLRTRRIGQAVAIDIHIRVNSSLLITEAHKIATDVETNLRNIYGNDTVISVHTEPEKHH